MNRYWTVVAFVGLAASGALGQSSSLYLESQARKARAAAATTQPSINGALRVNAGSSQPRIQDPNPALSAVSLTGIALPEPAVIQVHDLIGVIVRHRIRYQSRGRAEQKSEWDINAKLDAWLKFSDHKLGQQTFSRGKPEIAFSSENELKNKGTMDRQDVFETRIMAQVIDVKPNGNLVLMARSEVEIDDEVKVIVLTGQCNKNDVAANRTVTDDRVFDLRLYTSTEGMVTDGLKRGWLKKFTDRVKPF
ncbi:MAG: flagellar basal body L-ring protein FlgH [Planctomycetota bacterium]|nr:flagellar basal body L-ring protein FlgH [Planctomycetota bacterium]